VAARLEGLAEPGGICVSARVQEDVRGRFDITFADMGEQQLKNIAWPVRVYRAQLNGVTAAKRPALTLPDKPSIAVLPFNSMSGERDQEYLADGIVEAITAALSSVRSFFGYCAQLRVHLQGPRSERARHRQRIGRCLCA
jgi:adenylate cyclase